MNNFHCDACKSDFEIGTDAERDETQPIACPSCGKTDCVSEIKPPQEAAADGLIDDAAHKAATSPLNDLPNPTPAQIASGNYAKGHLTIAGFDIAIENPEGSQRKGVGPDGKPWSVTLKSHYGYFKSTSGADGEHVDVFVKPETAPDYDGPVWIVDQLNAWGEFDEHKVMLGWEDKDSAKAAYFEGYGEGWPKRRVGDIYAMTLLDFATWVQFPSTAKYYEPYSLNDEPLGMTADEVIILASDAKDGLCRIRQKVTRVDSLNANRRVYRRHVANAAVDALNPHCSAGAVLSEDGHPAEVTVCDRGSCGPRFVDGGPAKKTGRWDQLYHADADGWIWGDRAILDTEPGRALHEKILAGEAVGVSTRFRHSGGVQISVDGVNALAPGWMEFLSIDDVKNPAVKGAGEFRLLTDCELEELAIPEEAQDISSTSDEESSEKTMRLRAREHPNVNNITKLLRDFRSKVIAGASADEVNAAHEAVADEVVAQYKAGETLSPEHKQLLDKVYADATESIPGFKSGTEGPQGTMANELGDDPTSGWGAKELIRGQGMERMVNANTNTTPTTKTMITADETEEQKKAREFVEKQMAQADADALKAVHDQEVDEAIGVILASDHDLVRLGKDEQDSILDCVRKAAPNAKDVPTLIDALIAPISKAAADSTLAKKGYQGVRTYDPANPCKEMVRSDQPIPVMMNVEKLSAAYDDYMRENPTAADEYGWIDPKGPMGESETKRRKSNLDKMMPIVAEAFHQLSLRLAPNVGLAADSCTEEAFFEDLRQIAVSTDTAAYTSVVSSFYNQPTIAMWLLIQAFQDMKFLDFYTAMGPGQNASAPNIPGWQSDLGIGRVVKIPSETYVDASGNLNGAPFDMNIAENTGITPGTVKVFWDTFFAVWRKLATTLSIEAINAIGRGPLNYPAVARSLWHMAARKCRGIDTLLGNEMMNAALEYGATAVATEAYTTGGTGGLDLASNSVAVAAAPLAINLNPQKIASTTIASTDQSRTYGIGNSVGGVAPVAGLRLQCGGGASAAGTGTYCSRNIYGPTPIVPPRSTLTLDTNGADSTSTTNPLTVTLPASQVQGWLGNDGNIYSYPGTTATYAIDFLNGVILFKAGQVTRSSAVFTTATTVAPYSYATNFDYFILGQNNDAQVTLGTGETLQEYYNKAIAKIDRSAAAMASDPNYIKPDLMVTGVNIAAILTAAKIFYKLNSPDGTQLFPDEMYFARRNGVNLARVNAPTYWSANAAVITRKGTGKYAIDTPGEIRGPITMMDSNGNPIAGESYYMTENSAIFTPQVKNQSGVIQNAVSRALIFY